MHRSGAALVSTLMLAASACSNPPPPDDSPTSPPTSTAPHWIETEEPSAPPTSLTERAAGGIDGNPLPEDIAPPPAFTLADGRPSPSPDEVVTQPGHGDQGKDFKPQAVAYRSLKDFGITDPKTVALTFDDGPTRSTTKVQTILSEHEVPATFFVIGASVETYPTSVVRRLHDDGFSVQSHGYLHEDLSRVLDVPLESDLRAASLAIARGTGGYAPGCFRPPLGKLRADQLDNIADQNLQAVSWDVDPMDWAAPDSEAVVTSVLTQVRSGGSIVLLHAGDGKRLQTLEALPKIITTLRSEGYTFIELPCG